MEPPDFPKKFKNIARERNNEIMPRFQLAQIENEQIPLLDPLNFMLPLILGIYYNPKSRFEIAIATSEDLERNPEHRPLSEEYVHVGVAMTSEKKTSFFAAISDISDGLVFVRAVGGHSKTETIKETPNAEILKPYNVKYMPDILVHVTPFRNAFSIARQGLIPGGPDGRREHIHFLPLHALVHSPEHCRPNGDVVLFYSALNLDTNNIPLYMTKNYYIVTDTPIPHHCCIFAYDVRNKAEVKHRIFPLQEPEIIEQHDDHQTIMNVLSFYQEYFNNRLVLTEQHGRPFHAPSTTREARQITENSMAQEDFDALRRWTNQQLQANVAIGPLLEHFESEEGLPFAQRLMKQSGRKWPQDAEMTGEMDLERRKARWAEQRGEDISLIVPGDEEYGDYTDVDEEEEILEEQHADVLEEAIEEIAKRGKRPSPSPADTAASTADNASTITFRPRTQSTRHRSRTPEPGNIKSTNKMAREVLQDAHASERRKKRIFYQRTIDLTCCKCCDTAPLFCRGCGYAWCTECYFDREDQCVCPASLLSCEMPPDAA